MNTDATQSDGIFRSLYESIPQGIAIYSSTDGELFVIDAINRSGERMSGMKVGEIIGRSVCDVFPGVVEMGLYDVLRRVWETGTPETLPPVMYHDIRMSRYFKNQVFRLSDTTVAAVFNDVTEQILSDKKLQETEKRFRSLFETMHEGFAFHEVICNAAGDVIDYRYLDLNPTFEQLTGLKRETTVGRTVREVLPDIEEEWIQCFGRVALTGIPDERESYVKELDRYYRARAYSPKKGTFAVVFEETTERKRGEEELRKAAVRWQTTFDTLESAVWLLDENLRIQVANAATRKVFGVEPQEVVGSHCWEIVHGTREPIAECPAVRSMRTCKRETVELHVGSKWVEVTTDPVLDETGACFGIVHAVVDITERKRIEEELRQREEKFRTVADFTYDWEYWISPDGTLVYCSPSCLRLTGISADEFIADPMLKRMIIHPDDRAKFCDHLDRVNYAEEGLHESEFRIISRSGAIRWLSHVCSAVYGANGTYLGRRASNRDITASKYAEEERLALERQLLHAQKLESLGVMAGGIAHDFNNLLMAIMGNADLALMRLNPESLAVDNLRKIEQASARAADLARQMLAYSGKGRFVVEPLDLNILVEEMFHMLEISISKKAVLRLNPYRPLPSVEADATQMRQIIMNLVINASEAIGDRSGTIAVTTGVMDCDRNYLKDVWLDENISEGLYVYLEIADTGCGMDKDTLSKLFDPFFTTKFTGRGLGMAAVLGIVRGHKGAIKVYSEPGKGSTFKILLPASSRPAELFNGAGQNDHWKGSGTVLLVDDEETVRGIGSEMLKELGFQVITANDGREAVEIYRNTSDISFVILDLTMPHMDGEQCFRELRQLNTDAKVIMSSGFSEQEVTLKFAGKGLAGFIQKPYKLSTLKEAVRKVTAGPTAMSLQKEQYGKS